MSSKYFGWFFTATIVIVALIIGTLLPGQFGIPAGLPDLSTTVDTITMPDFVPFVGGNEMSEMQILGMLLLPILALIVGMGIGLTVIYPLIGKMVAKNEADEKYSSASKAIQAREKAHFKELSKQKPKGGIPNHNRYEAQAAWGGILFGLVASYVGAAFSESFLHGHDSRNWAIAFFVGTAIPAYLILRGWMKNMENSAGEAMDWGKIWVFLSGTFFVGLGLAIMMWVRTH